MFLNSVHGHHVHPHQGQFLAREHDDGPENAAVVHGSSVFPYHAVHLQ